MLQNIWTICRLGSLQGKAIQYYMLFCFRVTSFAAILWEVKNQITDAAIKIIR